jgi:hypothetical protein
MEIYKTIWWLEKDLQGTVRHEKALHILIGKHEVCNVLLPSFTALMVTVIPQPHLGWWSLPFADL